MTLGLKGYHHDDRDSPQTSRSTDSEPLSATAGPPSGAEARLWYTETDWVMSAWKGFGTKPQRQQTSLQWSCQSAAGSQSRAPPFE